MSGPDLRVVQFLHPGFEYLSREHLGPRSVRSGVMEWKPGRARHDRKFMLAQGAFFDPETGQDHQSAALALWGEWEGPSVFWRVESPGRPFPTVVHAPFLPATCPDRPVQNTDPFVFGDAIIYSNCMQRTYRSLRTLTAGSMVLFGRFGRTQGRGSFSLDTCLVIDRIEVLPTIPFDPETYGTDLLTDAVLSPLHTEGGDGELTVYSGLRRSPGDPRPFSFFPARLMGDEPPLFPRPELRPIGALEGVIGPNNMQGIRITSNLSESDRDAIWSEVVRQVVHQGCGLGHYASPPPLLERHVSERAAKGPPKPFLR